MKNEPVAYGMLTFCKNCGEQNPYPAKTLTEDTECQYCKQGCIRCDARKLLTDKEIEGIARANVDGHTSMEQLKWFARAILRKAQEK